MKTNDNFLYTMALGDSYGMKYEFVAHTQDKKADDFFHGPHPKFTDYTTGNYTDDTQMAIANVELLLTRKENPQAPFTQQVIVDKWLDAFKRDPHLGYSKHMYKLMTESQSADAFMGGLDASRGYTSGAAMRAGPFGLLPDAHEAHMLALLQGTITHNTAGGMNSAAAVALSVHYLHHGGQSTGLPQFLTANIGQDWNAADNDGTPGNGQVIVKQALDAVVGAKSLSEVFLRVVNQAETSDTDTVCAIAAVIASRASDIQDDLPQNLKSGLENGAYGADYLKQLDEKVLKAFPSQNLYGPKAPAKVPKFGR